MKRNLFSIVMLLTVFSSCGLYSQITITKDDLSRIYTHGRVITTYMDTVFMEVNIGNPGGGNSWDFSFLNPRLTSTTTVKDPASTPFQEDFPGANLVFYITSFGINDTADLFFPDIWSYNRLEDNLLTLGTGAKGKAMGMDIVSKTYNIPALITAKLPIVYGEKWEQKYADSSVSEFGLMDTYSRGETTVYTSVDAYGVLKMPSGRSVDVIRIKRDVSGYQKSQFGQYSRRRSVEYIFQGKNGDMMTIPTKDSLTPDNGIIESAGVLWTENLVTGLAQSSVKPSEFNLSRNYPNPFNPATIVEYSVPEEAYIDIKVFDILGREVSILVSRTEKPGAYKIKFDGKGLPGGIYILRMKAGSFTGLSKMTLLK